MTRRFAPDAVGNDDQREYADSAVMREWVTAAIVGGVFAILNRR